ncbi:MAG: hypothetical protein QOH06_5843 [Acidobacteriota bacterium]|jgi:diguanylate cyclase (GGDEF)-like protein|nr:hypothetical protein [Acidobacteriota bacterium]
MAVENDPSARPLVRHLPLPAVGIAVALSVGVIALWRFAPRLLPVFSLLLAWGTALLWGMAMEARRQGRESEEARRRLEGELARSAHDTDSLRQEVGGYRGLFESRPAERRAPAVPAPAPANVHNFIRDPLTGLFHRRYFEASVEREIHRMERRNLPLGIILMRVDAAETSEEILRGIGALLNRRVRGGDVASHHDGGIFGLILPEAPLDGVRTRAEQIRTAVREMEMKVTLSLGVAAFPDCGHSSEKLLRTVRAALDEARAGGGDCVAVAPGAVLDRRLMLPD